MADFASQPGDRYVRAASLWGFADFVAGLGGDPAALAERAGLDKRALTDMDALISWRRLSLLFELAAEELGKPSLGLDFALTIPPHFPNVGPVMLMTAFVDTTRNGSGSPSSIGAITPTPIRFSSSRTPRGPTRCSGCIWRRWDLPAARSSRRIWPMRRASPGP